MEHDWRLMGQENWLQSRHFRPTVWRSYRDGWDHDHCEFCGRHISVPLAPDDPEAVDRGYVTDDDYNWVCEECFADFRDRFEWTTDPGV